MSGAPLAGRVAVVSGGGKGLGRAVSLHLAALGASVVVNNRNRTAGPDGRGPADHVVEEIVAAGGQAVADYGDAADPGSGPAMVGVALERWGRLDIAVPNAGISHPAMFHNQDDDAFAEVITVNLLGAAALARAAMRVMRPAGFGRIVLMASTGGLHGVVGESAYAASKGAMIALGRTLAVEGAARGVTTNILLPYAITQMTERGDETAEERAMLSAESVAPVVAALVDPDARLNGECLVVGAGQLRRAGAVEWAAVPLPGDGSPAGLAAAVDASRAGPPEEFPDAVTAFRALLAGAAR